MAWLEQQRVPVLAQVVGEKEAAEGTVNVRTRDNVVHGMHAVEDVKQAWTRDCNTLTLPYREGSCRVEATRLPASCDISGAGKHAHALQ